MPHDPNVRRLSHYERLLIKLIARLERHSDALSDRKWAKHERRGK